MNDLFELLSQKIKEIKEIINPDDKASLRNDVCPNITKESYQVLINLDVTIPLCLDVIPGSSSEKYLLIKKILEEFIAESEDIDLTLKIVNPLENKSCEENTKVKIKGWTPNYNFLDPRC